MYARRDHEIPSYEVPWMYDEGCVVLDLNNHPVKAYRDIPLTLSSKVEAALMEVIRRIDPRISIIDFWARLLVHLFLAPSQQGLTGTDPRNAVRVEYSHRTPWICVYLAGDGRTLSQPSLCARVPMHTTRTFGNA